jgi:glycosyltransferase involved in cell wall biosynthesis
MDISVVICCYNSANLIKKTLEYIVCQDLVDLSCEVILVDNNCTDDTVSVAITTWKNCGNPFSLNIIKENRAGLSYARKRGVLASKGKIIIFCDDDNWLESNYVSTSFQYFLSNKKCLGACSKAEAVSDVEFPDWFKDYQSFYACGLPQLNEGSDNLITLRGAGMIIRGEILRQLYKLGIKNTLSDRKGKELNSSGDDELSYWLEVIGGELKYLPNLHLQHFISPERLTIDYRDKLLNGIFRSVKLLNLNKKLIRKLLFPFYIGSLKWIFSSCINGKALRIRLFGALYQDPIYLNYKILQKFKISQF